MTQDQTPLDEPDPAPVSTDSEVPAAPGARPVRAVVWPVVAVGALLLGLLVGYNAPGRNPAVVPPEQPASSSSPPLTPRATSGDATVAARAQVNAACLRSLNDAQNVYVVLGGMDTAVSDVDLGRLDQMVRDLQPLQKLLQRDLSECEVNTAVANGESEAPPPTPTSTTAPASVRTVTNSPPTPTATPS
ncbi:hypothetical protein [Tessaracoccus antarcticus]|uniref:Uncharacterized protein n=1 Tax=Tessaracoccus antarcticus TaxID=2479848 RepID=A0A3M0GAX8_9ACTN|nr:hypothetical protein [Tessaracoccus antarcticus]RMB61467.1 hypothetical protein EAX62_02130 [Tessaracoccus antarcticus]